MKKLLLLAIFISVNLFGGEPSPFRFGIDTKSLAYHPATELTIASGVITINSGNHFIDTEGDASTDDLVTINVSGVAANTFVQFRQANSARVSVFKNGTGNIITGSSDFTLENDLAATFYYDGTNFILSSGGGGGGSVTYTANRAVITDSLGALGVSTTTDSEILHVNGVTSQLSGNSQSATYTNKDIDADNNTITNIGDDETKAGIAANKIELNEIATATYDDVNDWWNNIQSSGVISGGEITDDGDGTITVSAGIGFIKSTNSDIGANMNFDWSSSTSITVTTDSINYIYVDYNAGTPVLGSATSNTANGQTIFNLGKVYREGTSIDIINSGLRVYNFSKRVQQHHVEEAGLHFTSGAAVSETGTRNIAITAGVMYAGLNRIVTDAIDTSVADTFEYYYYNGAAWIESDQTQIDNLQYNNIATGLATLSNNQYGVHWTYKGSGTNTYVIYGQDSYTLSEAQSAQPPSSLPEHVSEMGVLRAKIIILKSATVFTEIESVDDTVFQASTPTVHNDLSGLDGGVAGQYYHFDLTDYTALTTSTLGDIWYSSATNLMSKLGIGSTDDVLTVTGGIPAWETPDTTAYKTTVTTGDSRWTTNLLSLTHGIDGSIPADELQYQFIGVTTGDKYEPDYDITGSSTTVAAYSFTNCGKPTESIKASLVSSGGSGTGDGTDTSAIHVNESGEIVAITEKTSPVGDDEIVIEDSAASNAKKSSKIQNAVNSVQPQKPLVNAQTGTTYTLVLGDAGYIVTMTNSSANTLTIPTNASAAFETNSTITIGQLGAGVTTIEADTGVTLNGESAGSVDISAQYGPASLVKIGTDAWWIFGSIGTVE